MELLDVILVAASEAVEALDDLLDLLVLDLLAPRARLRVERKQHAMRHMSDFQ